MQIGSFDLEREVLVIAEIGNNHEGDVKLAKDLIGIAKEAGAGAVKFQTFIPEKLVTVNDKARIQQLKKFCLSYEDFEILKQIADRENIIFLSTPFDIESARFLNHLVPAVKIASGDNNFFPLIEEVARFGKPIILSTGLMGIDEVKKVMNRIQKIWEEDKINQELALLHSVVCYPTEIRDANLLAIHELKKLNVTVGYSDHTLGIEAAVLSVALGARIIEKHFTLSKDYSEFRDHRLSADPKDLKQLVNRVKEAQEMLGGGEKKLFNCEEQNLSKVRRSIVASLNLEKGTLIEWRHLDWVRSAGGLSPGEERKVVGKRLKRFLSFGEPILLTDIE